VRSQYSIKPISNERPRDAAAAAAAKLRSPSFELRRGDENAAGLKIPAVVLRAKPGSQNVASPNKRDE